MLFNALILFFLTVSLDVSIIIMQKLNLWLHEFVGIMSMNYQHYIFQHDIFERPFHTWNLFASGTTFNKNTQPNRTKLKLWIEHWTQSQNTLSLPLLSRQLRRRLSVKLSNYIHLLEQELGAGIKLMDESDLLVVVEQWISFWKWVKKIFFPHFKHNITSNRNFT